MTSCVAERFAFRKFFVRIKDNNCSYALGVGIVSHTLVHKKIIIFMAGLWLGSEHHYRLRNLQCSSYFPDNENETGNFNYKFTNKNLISSRNLLAQKFNRHFASGQSPKLKMVKMRA